mgnify:CR=1 FL=1|jgi:hypothetical protein
MQQITLELDSDENGRPTLTLEPECEQRLIALMAQVLVAVVQNQGGEDHEGQ